MNQLLNRKKAGIMAVIINICFLLVHMLMLYIFSKNNVTPMVKFNIFSIIFYLVMLIIIRMGFLLFFNVATYLEVVLHMTLAIIYTGWDNGFQITLIGMNALAFFAEYIGRTVTGRYIPAAPLGILGMVAYLSSYIYTHNNPVPYNLSEGTIFSLQIIWALIVFVLLILSLQLFTLLSFHSERLLSIAATKDKLTNLPNRYHVAKYEKEYLSDNRWIAMADIDNFKKINDTYGHNFGDFVLKKLAELMQNEIPDSDICRWGGEEFLIIGKGNDIDKAYDILDSFRKKVEAFEFSYDNTTIHLTITIGLDTFKNDVNMTKWVNTADKKLYAGKYSGKNRVVI